MQLTTTFFAVLMASLATATTFNNGPLNDKADSEALRKCVQEIIDNPNFNGDGWECGNHHFQFGRKNGWRSASDCIGKVCSSSLLGAADQGAEWAKCDQKANIAMCWVGWSPIGMHMCNEAGDPPCKD